MSDNAATTPGARSARAARRAQLEAGRRLPMLLLLAVLAAVTGFAGVRLDRRETPASDVVFSALPAELASVAPSGASLGSTWYCAAGTGTAGVANHWVHIENPGAQAIDVTITVVPGAAQGVEVDQAPVTSELEVAARSTTSVRLADLVDAPFLAAIVEAGPGEIAVEHAVGNSSDLGAAPCASSASPTWYLAAGVTTRDASELLVLFNPFPGDAVIDVTFTTPEGLRSPPAFAGFIVPGRRVVAVDIGAVVSRHPNVSIAVTARSGRVVAERLQAFDGSDGPAGLALTPAAPSPALVWSFPDGLVAEGISEVVTVFNPSDQPAEVDVEVALDPPTDPSQPVGADPFELSIAPHQYAQVAIQDDDRVPDGRGHSLTVRGQNGVPVVAERWVRSASPAPRTGLAATLGSPIVATRWLSTLGSSATGQSLFLVIANPDPSAIARVSITAPTPQADLAIEGLEDVEIPAFGRVVIDLGQHVNRDRLSLVIESTLPVVVERGVYPGGTGFAQSIVVASGPAASVAAVDTG